MNWLRKKIKNELSEFVQDVVFREIRIGGHCGLCGQWVPHDLVWVGDRVTICGDCLRAGEEKEKGWRKNNVD